MCTASPGSRADAVAFSPLMNPLMFALLQWSAPIIFSSDFW
jgi:hypothetical protein